MSLAIAAVLLGALQDRPSTTFLKPDRGIEQWSLRGETDLSAEAELMVGARRIERRWNPVARTVSEFPSEELVQQALVERSERTFRAMLKKGPTGLYAISVSSEEGTLVSRRIPLGRVHALFAGSKATIRKLLELAERGKAYLGELERVGKDGNSASEEARNRFLKRLNADERILKAARGEADLTATVERLSVAYWNLRNAQVWEDRAGIEDAENDPIGAGGERFLEEDVTTDSLRKEFAEIPKLLSLELRVGVATLLAEFLDLADAESRLRESARKAVGESIKLAREAPDPDPAFVEILEEIQRDREPQAARSRLREYARERVR